MPQIKNIVPTAIILLACWTCSSKAQEEDPGSPLFLTPLIKSGETIQAREAALVKDFSTVVSYSGYITVDEIHNSNLFFWYFPAEESPNEAPVILFNDGGPGVSCMFTIFNSGPFNGNATSGDFTLNPLSLHKKYHMIFIDNPVDVGFSFTDHEDGYVFFPEEAARDMYEFLVQFFTMFPNLQKNKFYSGGESFGGTYAIEMGTVIHQRNSEDQNIFINFQGLITDSPLYDYYSQGNFADIMFHAGLINRTTHERYLNTEKRIMDLIDDENFREVNRIWLNYVYIDIPAVTGYNAIYHIAKEHQSASTQDMTVLIEKKSTRRAIHVGSKKFQGLSSLIIVERMMPSAYRRSTWPKLDALLKEGYKLLVYVGNMDIITGPLGIESVIRKLTWEHAGNLVDGPREIWKDDAGVAGYVTKAGNSSAFVVFRNAGHVVIWEEAQRTLDLIGKFVDDDSGWLYN